MAGWALDKEHRRAYPQRCQGCCLADCPPRLTGPRSPARPCEGLLMMAVQHRREATWQTTARPDLGATFARVGAKLVSSRGRRGSVGASSMTPGPSAATIGGTIGGKAPLCAGSEQARRPTRLSGQKLAPPAEKLANEKIVCNSTSLECVLPASFGLRQRAEMT